MKNCTICNNDSTVRLYRLLKISDFSRTIYRETISSRDPVSCTPSPRSDKTFCRTTPETPAAGCPSPEAAKSPDSGVCRNPLRDSAWWIWPAKRNRRLFSAITTLHYSPPPFVPLSRFLPSFTPDLPDFWNPDFFPSSLSSSLSERTSINIQNPGKFSICFQITTLFPCFRRLSIFSARLSRLSNGCSSLFAVCRNVQTDGMFDVLPKRKQKEIWYLDTWTSVKRPLNFQLENYWR